MDTSIKEENKESVNIYFFRKIKKGKKWNSLDLIMKN